MARLLVHYDIPVEENGAFRAALDDSKFEFERVTNSVYCVNEDALDETIEELKTVLLNASDGFDPKATSIFIEKPGTTNDRPDIIPVKVR